MSVSAFGTIIHRYLVRVHAEQIAECVDIKVKLVCGVVKHEDRLNTDIETVFTAKSSYDANIR